MARRRVLLIASSLGTGGLERQAIAMAAGMDVARFDVRLATMHAGGGLEPEAQKMLGRKLVPLCGEKQWQTRNLPLSFARLVRLVMQFRPHVVYGLQPVVNEMAFATARLCGAKCLIGLRFSNVDWTRYSKVQAVAYKTSARLSGIADGLVANSHAGLMEAEKFGFSLEKASVVANGIDTGRFVIDKSVRIQTRTAWGIPQDVPVIGQVGRLDPMKDYPMFYKAAALLRKQYPDARFVVAGGPEQNVPAYEALAREHGLGESVILLGPVADMEKVYPAFDVLALCSAFGEGFPNVVGEAMACGVPCAVTDTGDAARIVSGSGEVVAPGDFESMAKSWKALLCKGGYPVVEAREHMVQNYSLPAMIAKVESLISDVSEGA